MELLWSKVWVEYSERAPDYMPSLSNNDQSSDQPDYSEQYAIVASPSTVMKFDHHKGVALCIEIDKQFTKLYEDKSLGSVVTKNAEDMGKAFVTNWGLSQECVTVCTPSAQPEQCSRAGICNLFVKTARKAEQNSIFIFYFSGHGFSINRKCVLAPSDFVGTSKPNSGISGDDLVKWMREAQCQASYALFIFDCCYAGGLGTSLTSPSNVEKVIPEVFVMCGCAARERCTSIDALGHSIFTFFMLRYLVEHNCMGQFAIKQAMEEITDLCFSLSSLIVTYSKKKHRLKFGRMNPTLHVSDVCRADVIDSSRYELLYSLYRHGPKPVPHPEIDRWLKSQAVQLALQNLLLSSKVQLFRERLNDGVLCALLYSTASIQVAHDKTHLKERNFFIRMTIIVLESITTKIELSVVQVIRGLRHYLQPLKEDRIDVQTLEKLLSELYDMASEPYSYVH